MEFFLKKYQFYAIGLRHSGSMGTQKSQTLGSRYRSSEFSSVPSTHDEIRPSDPWMLESGLCLHLKNFFILYCEQVHSLVHKRALESHGLGAGREWR